MTGGAPRCEQLSAVFIIAVDEAREPIPGSLKRRSVLMKNLVLLKERRAGRLAASTIAVAGAIGLAAAGCGGGGQDQSGAAAGGSSAGLVSVGSVDGSEVLVDAEGATLYSAEVEKGG